MKVIILADANAVAVYGATMFQRQLQQKPASVLGLATGSTPVALYRELIARNRSGELSFRQVTSFNLDEYLGLAEDHPQSYRQFMQSQLFGQVDIELANTHVPPGNAADPHRACTEYEDAIKQAGGIDLQLLGIGRNGHIGFNEPSSSLASRTRIKTLTRETIADNARFFADDEYQPQLSITMGIGTILEARRILLLATGANKADAIAATVEGPITAACPASALQLHPQVTVVIDEAAASQLKDTEFYKHIEKQNQILEERLRE